MNNIIDSLLPHIIDIRHKLHANPEVGFEGIETQKIIIEVLENFGYKVQKNIGGTGIVAILDSNKPGKTIAFRADFDALPILEANLLSYCSKNHGYMHACGHDGHTAILLCVAGVLIKIKDKLKGRIKFIFQPAEELGDGAKAMIADKVLENPHVDAIYALHNFPRFPAGHIGVRSNCILAGMDAFDIEITGLAGHGSIPEKCINPITIAAKLLNNLNDITTQLIAHDPISIISFTQINAGNTLNVIPETVFLSGITRFSTVESQNYIKKAIREQLSSITDIDAVKSKLVFTHSSPAVTGSTKARKYGEQLLATNNLFWQENVVGYR